MVNLILLHKGLILKYYYMVKLLHSFQTSSGSSFFSMKILNWHKMTITQHEQFKTINI